MRFLTIAIATAAAAASNETATMLPLAGVCTGDAGVGVGCGFDASRATAFGLTIAPKKSVLRLPWCEEHCYASCPPQQPIAFECEDCVFYDTTAPGGGACYRQPYAVAAVATPTQGGCYETLLADDTDAYQEMTSKTTTHESGGFFFHHSHSKTTKDFYQMFFEKNFSMALSYKYAISHLVQIAPISMYPEPSRELQAAALLLPAKFEGNEHHYQQFIDDFGTHYMEQAYMGGSALMTNYFHSCFLHTFSEHDVSEASHSSFIGIFNDNSAKGWGSAIDKQMWESYSQIDVKLNGGAAAQFGVLDLNNTLDPAAVAAWQSTIDQNSMVPLTYTLRPITHVMKSGWLDDAIVDNVRSALTAYDALVGTEMQELQDSLVPQDHYKLPSWCKDPKAAPASARLRGSASAQPASSLDDLPGCPALPPAPAPAASGAHADAQKAARAARAAEATQSMADPLVPGLLAAAGDSGSLFGRGYDPIQQSPRSLVAEWHFDGWATKGGLSPDPQSVTGNTWVDPQSGRRYGLPDEIQIFNTPAAGSDGGQHLFINSSAFKKWHWSQHSTSINLGIFSYSHSDLDTYVSQLLDTKTAVIAVTNRVDISYEMSLLSADVLKCEMQATCAPSSKLKETGTQVNSSFALRRAALPTGCAAGSSDAAEYALFRETFGTHYVQSAVFGGMLQFVLAVNSSLYTKMSSEEIMEQTSIGFNILFAQFNYTHVKEEQIKDVTQEFRENTQVVLVAYGGNTLLLEEGNYDKWAASVPANPAPINATFRSISDLFVKGSSSEACMESESKSYLASKPAQRYRCGNAAGVQIPTGLPRPGAKPRITHRSLPTLDEIGAGRIAPAASAPAPAALSARSHPHSSAGIPCDPDSTIPGGSSNDLIGKTFDVKTGSPRLLATPFTCTQGKTWWSPTMNKLLQVPDQLDFVDVSAACDEESMSTITNSTSAWKSIAEAWGFYFGLDLPLSDVTIKIGIGFEKQMREMAAKMANYTKSMSSLKRSMSMYRLGFGAAGSAPLALGSELQLALSNLPVISGGYSQGTAAQRKSYDTFVAAFGTHYVAAADYGAHCEFSTALNQSYVSQQSSKFVEEQISISIGIQEAGIGLTLDLGYGTIQQAMKQDEDFKKHAESSKTCSGGDTTLLDQNPPQYDKWVESVYAAPASLNGTTVLRPLAELLVGDNDAASKRSCLQEAIKHYMGIKPSSRLSYT